MTRFEFFLFELGLSRVSLCPVIYRPPKYNKNFISDFSEFLAEFFSKYDRVLTIGDFNIHNCCTDEPFCMSFLYVIESFNFMQSMSRPTDTQDTHSIRCSCTVCVSPTWTFVTLLSRITCQYHLTFSASVRLRPLLNAIACSTPLLQLCSQLFSSISARCTVKLPRV